MLFFTFRACHMTPGFLSSEQRHGDEEGEKEEGEKEEEEEEEMTRWQERISVFIKEKEEGKTRLETPVFKIFHPPHAPPQGEDAKGGGG